MDVIESHGARIPVLGFGTMTLKEDVCVQLVEASLKLGYRHLDTAQMYGNEREVGSGMRGSALKREDVFLTTKVWFTRLALAISSAPWTKAWSAWRCHGSTC